MCWLGLVKYWLDFTKAENENQYLNGLTNFTVLFKIY